MKTVFFFKLIFWFKVAIIGVFLGFLARVFFGKSNFNFLDLKSTDFTFNKEDV